MKDLFPLLRQLANWFKELVGEWGVMSKVRFSKLKTGLSSSDNPVKVEVDIAAFGRREGRAFHVLGEECALYTDTLFRFRDRFQFPEGVRVCLPYEGEGACHFSPR